MRHLWKGVSRGNDIEGPQQLKSPAAQAGRVRLVHTKYSVNEYRLTGAGSLP